MPLIDWKLKLAAVAIALAAFFFWHKVQVSSAVEIALAAQEMTFKEQLLVEQQKVQELTSKTNLEIKQAVDQAEKEKQDEILGIKSKYNSIIAGLRERNSRKDTGSSTGSGSNSESTARCTGKELYREDAEFLLGEATRADEIRIALKACYKQYDAVKISTDKLRLDYNLQAKQLQFESIKALVQPWIILGCTRAYLFSCYL